MFRKLFATILLTAVGAGIGFQATQLLPTKWQAVARFEQPKVIELGNYFSLRSTYALVSGASNATDINQVETEVSAESYQKFITNLTTESLVTNFIASSDLLKNKAQLEGKSTADLGREVADQMQFNPQTGEWSLMTTSANETNQILRDYLRFINEQTRQQLSADFSAKWNTLFQQVKTAADAKIDASWENKLKMMNSVKPLDNKTVTFRFAKLPEVSAIRPNPLHWIGGGAAAGLVLSLLMIVLFATKSKPNEP